MNNADTSVTGEVRLTILREHSQLAQLLDEIENSARQVLSNASVSPAALHSALDLLHTRFVRHLEYEDAHLHGSEVTEDHVDQRSRLDGLVHDQAVFGDPRTLAREATCFVHLMRKDMEDEDTKLRASGP